jgi:type 2 lantibiotic biosynthesis protein LanM
MSVLDCGDHGWVEFVEHRPCENREEVCSFYRRAGALVAVIYALEGTDYHNENLIAHGEFPVPIDQEGLFHHRARLVDATGRGLNGDQTADNRLAHSVIRTALLPYWRFGENGRSLDISALGGQFDEESFVKLPRWDHVNTDRMRLVYEHHISRNINTNVVRLDGVVQSVNDFLFELEEGFCAGYRALVAERESLLEARGGIDAFSDQLVRFIYRDTRVYFLLQRHSLSPRFLRSGLDRSLQLEILFRGFLPGAGVPAHPFLRLIGSEIAAIEELDIPMFQPRSSSVDLELPDGEWIRGCFVEASLESVRKRIGLLGEDDLALQMRILRGSLATRAVRPQQERSSVGVGRRGDFAPLDRSVLMEEALAIAGGIERAAVWQDESTVSWIGFVHVIEANRSQLQQLPWRLYDGSLGVAVFLGALGAVLGESGPAGRFGRLARAAIAPMRAGMRRVVERKMSVQPIVKELGLGAGLGVGSLIYGFVHLADWLGDEALIGEAEGLADGIREDVIAADEKLDLMFGSAGGVLGLLALHRVRPDGGWLGRAVLCGEHLLAKRVSEPVGRRAWSENGQRPLTGMSHGAAGFAHALSALAAATGRVDFADAAREAVAYEDSVYRAEDRNWPDFRPPGGDPPPCWCSWCHGAPGILLSRVEALGGHDDEGVRRDIDVALRTTLERSLTPIDHLCCGNLGRADIVLTAGLRLGRAELVEASGSIVAGVVTRARQSGGYGLGNDPEYSLNLFQGLSGVGYALLRQVFPEKLPSLLSWR